MLEKTDSRWKKKEGEKAFLFSNTVASSVLFLQGAGVEKLNENKNPGRSGTLK